MHITFLVSNLLSGGAERTVSYLSSYLANNGWNVTLLSISDDIFYSIDPKVELVTLSVPRGAKNRVQRYIHAFNRYYKTNKYLKENEPDVVFCMLPETSKYIFKRYQRSKYKLITSERNNPMFERSDIQEFKQKLFRACDGIVFQTERAKSFYSNEIGSKGRVIHNAVGNEMVYDLPEVSERKKKISAVGRLAEQKDYITLFKAFASVIKHYPDYVLEIFGNDNGEYAEYLKNEARNLGLDGKIIFKGVCRDAIVQASDSTCYVMSSKFEGMPNALMEAMAAGLPCISTDCPNGPAELIENEVNGLLVPVGDVAALEGAMLRYIEDPAFAENCGKNARAILRTHSIDVKAKEYAEFIEKVVNTKKDD
ncbi:MAG: glycosyltransferase family 4 protein [Ruminococcaceae bacterium]|nr:glycosyltransferase family 4 protein [Oscillospiraceae bacterium]